MDLKKFKEGVRLFNSSQFFEAHEAWEEIWLAADKKSLEGQYLMGLIQYAAFLLKLSEAKHKAAATLGENALAKLGRACKDEEWLSRAKAFFEKYKMGETVSLKDFPRIVL